MRSHARLTYNQAFAALFEGRPEARAQIGPLVDKLLPLVDVYRVLVKARHERGALDFDAPEPKFVLNDAEQITAIDLPLRNDAHKLIEECMVLANVATARELRQSQDPDAVPRSCRAGRAQARHPDDTFACARRGHRSAARDHHARPAEDRAAHQGSGGPAVHRDSWWCAR